MAKKKKELLRKPRAYIDSAGFTYNLYRSPLDYYDDKDDYFLNNLISEYSLQLLAESRKDGFECLQENIKDILDEYEKIDENYFANHTPRVLKLLKKYYKKEETILRILKNLKEATATTDIRKLKKHHSDLKVILFQISSVYDGNNIVV